MSPPLLITQNSKLITFGVSVIDSPVFSALADPMRRRLLKSLAEHSPRTATQLARDYPISRQGILKHLLILEDAGLVAATQQGREKRYTFNPKPLIELEQFVQDITRLWDDRLLRLKDYLENESPDSTP